MSYIQAQMMSYNIVEIVNLTNIIFEFLYKSLNYWKIKIDSKFMDVQIFQSKR